MFDFLGLPRELRDMVYKYYVREDGGYTYNPETGKFLVDGRPVDLSLMYTCRLAFAEMEGLPFQENALNFSTWYSEDLCKMARYFHHGIRTLSGIKRGMVNWARVSITKEIVDLATSRYPQFRPFVEHLAHDQEQRYEDMILRNNHVDAPSLHRDFVDYILSLLLDHPDFKPTVADAPFVWRSRHQRGNMTFDPAPSLALDIKPWTIPTTTELTSLDRTMPRHASRKFGWEYKYRYSAATVALQFLTHLSQTLRLQVRSVILREDRVAVAFPECHGRGFIPLCVENPKLRIEGRVDLWRNALISGFGSRDLLSGLPDEDEPPLFGRESEETLSSCTVTYSLAPWITEALALPSLGMPEGSFTLLLDGGPIPETTSRMFGILQRDAAWQEVQDEYFVYDYAAPGFLETYFHRISSVCYHFESLPEFAWDLVNNASDLLVKCNFPVGPPSNPDQISEEHEGLDWEELKRAYMNHEPKGFQTDAPLPAWAEICDEEFLHDVPQSERPTTLVRRVWIPPPMPNPGEQSQQHILTSIGKINPGPSDTTTESGQNRSCVFRLLWVGTAKAA